MNCKDLLRKKKTSEVKRILTENRYRICKYLCPDQVIKLMATTTHMTKNEVSKIFQKRTMFNRSAALLFILSKKPMSCFLAFLHALHATQQCHLMDLLQISLPEVCQKKVFDCETYIDVHDGPGKLVIDKTTLEFYYRTKTDSYDLLSLSRGHVAIVTSQTEEVTALQARDVSNLSLLFSELGYKCVIWQEQCFSEIKKRIEIFANNSFHRNSASCVVICLSYSELSPNFEEEFIDKFNNNCCKMLQNKPKLLIFVASQQRNSSMSPVFSFRSSSSMAFCDDAQSSTSQQLIPSSSDLIIVHLTSSVQIGSRHGSSHVQSFIHCVAKHAKNKDLLEILTAVNGVLKSKFAKEQHEAVEFVSTLCKKLYLYPGLHSAKNL